MKLKPYPKYKDSGVKWIGEIPEEWEFHKINQIFEIIGSGTTPNSQNEAYYENGVIPWVITGDLNNSILNDTSKKISRDALRDHSTLKLYGKDSLLIAMYGATIGKISLLNLEACVNQACCVLANSKILDPKFAFYWFLANKINIISLSYGGGQPNISQDTIKSLRIQVPTLLEQKRIIHFLDKKTSEIDLTIKKDTRLIELLNEKRTALINHVVTKGLDPTAEMKDSGVEWIGEIPEDWEIKKLKYVSDLIPGQSPHESTYNTDGNGSILVNGPNEYSESDFGYTRSLKWTTAPKKWAPSNSLLFCMRGSTTGRLNIAHTNISIGRGVAAIVAKNDQDYLNYIMITLRPYVLGNSRGSTFPSVTTDDLGNYLVPEPSSTEQTKISGYLSKSTSKIDKTIQKIEENIGLLEEYKKSLIHHVVTGKVNVIKED